MDDKLINRFITKIKDKLTKNKAVTPTVSEYAFSTEELENINKQNKQKIQDLKQDIFSKDKKTKEEKNNIEDTKELPIIEEETKKEEEITKDKPKEITEESKEESLSIQKTVDKEEKPQQNSFINLNEEHQKLVMNKWNEINLSKIDNDIIEGKDLLNHNYTITYADDAAKFIHHIRKEYEIVICYLIGFNNEKQGIMNKTIFSSKIDEEWKYLSNYIKVLEKIRNFKK